MVSFNSKAYATTITILHWLLKQLLPELGGLTSLLIMDLLRSHTTKPVKKLLKKNDITLSMVPAGCTGSVQPVDISFNRPFKDMLKEEINKEFEGAVTPELFLEYIEYLDYVDTEERKDDKRERREEQRV